MPDRLTPERLEEIRLRAWSAYRDAIDSLTEIDALRRERDEARAKADSARKDALTAIADVSHSKVAVGIAREQRDSAREKLGVLAEQKRA